jgi:hypothetical protein
MEYKGTAMRLLDSASFRLYDFATCDVPQYVILSHTWGTEEVSFQDLQDLTKAKEKKGFSKLKRCCKKAQLNGLQWVWIDTCCIDKSSSAELSEAINSIYQWYQDSHICYAYLEAVAWRTKGPHAGERGPLDWNLSSFERSRWFKRGWTLQELIAPPVVEFYDLDWIEIGTKLSLVEKVSQITGIHMAVLEDNRYKVHGLFQHSDSHVVGVQA